MRIDTRQHLRMDQRMKMAPRMIQSMEILQMSALALEARIEQELASNPTLELREPDTDSDEDEIAAEQSQAERDANEGERELVVRDDSVDKNHADDFERLSNISEEYGEVWEADIYESGDGYRRKRSDGERDRKMDAMANTAARPESLVDQLLAQWHLVETTDEIQKAGEYLIGFIDDDGYLRTDRQTLLNQAPPHIRPQHLDPALELIQQSLEPVGIGARDLRECLLLQIDARARQNGTPDLSAERTLVSDHLKDLANNRLPQIAKRIGLTIEQVIEAKDGLKQFDPRPGRLLVDDSPRLITPDAVVEYDEQQDYYTARLTSGRLPAVHISPRYLKMIKQKNIDRQTKEFVNQNLRSARWLIDAIEQRDNTLLRVISVVIDAQRDFFDQGLQSLHPLPMTMVADQLGIHVATVSRAVSEKYLQTPRGIEPLRMFFSGGTETESGDAMSWAAIQAKLEQIIDEEDKSNPLSDDLLMEKLKAHGIDIARRTVAKYRKQLNIPPARQRKEY
ncbi:MAG: RNA polymerase factor sigma-54 [Phycisphaeraceae bacterium]